MSITLLLTVNKHGCAFKLRHSIYLGISSSVFIFILLYDFSVLVPQYNIEKVIRRLPQLHDADYWATHLEKTDKKEYLVLPGSNFVCYYE